MTVSPYTPICQKAATDAFYCPPPNTFYSLIRYIYKLKILLDKCFSSLTERQQPTLAKFRETGCHFFDNGEETCSCCFPKRLIGAKLRGRWAIIPKLDRNGKGLGNKPKISTRRAIRPNDLTDRTCSMVPSLYSCDSVLNVSQSSTTLGIAFFDSAMYVTCFNPDADFELSTVKPA